MIQDALRASPDAARLWNKVSEEIQSPKTLGPDPMGVALSDSDRYIQFFIGNLEYAIFPHARILVFAMSFGKKKRDMARQRAAGQIKKNVMDETWTQAPNLSKIADIFARTSSLIGKCRLPLYFSKTKADEWFDIWRVINEERVERNDWSFVGAKVEQASLHPTITAFRRIAERNQAKARLRYLRARRMASQDANEEVWGEDSFSEEPSEDGSLPPDHSEFPLTLPGALS